MEQFPPRRAPKSRIHFPYPFSTIKIVYSTICRTYDIFKKEAFKPCQTHESSAVPCKGARLIPHWEPHLLPYISPQPEGNSDVGTARMQGIWSAAGTSPQGSAGGGTAGIRLLVSDTSSNPKSRDFASE